MQSTKNLFLILALASGSPLFCADAPAPETTDLFAQAQEDARRVAREAKTKAHKTINGYQEETGDIAANAAVLEYSKTAAMLIAACFLDDAEERNTIYEEARNIASDAMFRLVESPVQVKVSKHDQGMLFTFTGPEGEKTLDTNQETFLSDYTEIVENLASVTPNVYAPPLRLCAYLAFFFYQVKSGYNAITNNDDFGRLALTSSSIMKQFLFARNLRFFLEEEYPQYKKGGAPSRRRRAHARTPAPPVPAKLHYQRETYADAGAGAGAGAGVGASTGRPSNATYCTKYKRYLEEEETESL